jgi:antitoxin MazE
MEGMTVTIKKWGNSAAIRIPAAVLEATRLRLDEPVEIREEEGRIVIEPIRAKSYDLDELLKKVTPENIHEETDWGPPIGKEIW